MKMNKMLVGMLAIDLCLTLLSGCGSKYISKDEAKTIALSDAGFSSSDIKDYDIELDKDIGSAVYEIDFEVGFDDYEYTIDAESGEILKSKVD